MEKIIEVTDLEKSFKGKKAVNGVSFSINRGEITAILGPNGAGKTTTINMMLGLLKPSQGQVKLFGKTVNDKNIFQKVGVMLQEVSVMDALKVKELIHIVRGYYQNPLSFNDIITLSGLTNEDLNKRTEKLSGGQKRKVNFALAIAGNPDVLFLDEPTVGMDVTIRKRFWETLQAMVDKGKTVIFTTHYLQEADDYAKRILLFNHGELVADGTPEEIKTKIAKQSVSFVASEDFPVIEFLDLPFVSDVTMKEGRVIIYTDDTDSVLAKIFENKWFIKDIAIEKGRLEEAFD